MSSNSASGDQRSELWTNVKSYRHPALLFALAISALWILALIVASPASADHGDVDWHLETIGCDLQNRGGEFGWPSEIPQAGTKAVDYCGTIGARLKYRNTSGHYDALTSWDWRYSGDTPGTYALRSVSYSYRAIKSYHYGDDVNTGWYQYHNHYVEDYH